MITPTHYYTVNRINFPQKPKVINNLCNFVLVFALNPAKQALPDKLLFYEYTQTTIHNR